MKTPVMLAGILLLTTFLSYGLDQPVKVWEKWYYSNWDGCHFRDIELTSNGNLFITGSAYDWTIPIEDYYCAFLLDQEGNVLWEVEQPWYVGKGNDGAILPDGSFVITGRSVVTSEDTYSLFIMKIDQNGSIDWTKIYDFPDTKEEGYGITCLPDGGFAVCGRVHGTGTINAGQMWLLRTDANGDTLWTREWGSTVANSPDWGKTVLFNNDELCVLAHGLTESQPTYGPHLLFYDLGGSFLRATNYTELYWQFARGMCLGSDGGYTFTTAENPVLWHTDKYGATLWELTIPHYGIEEGYGVIRTMDSGYLFCGWGGFWGYPPSSPEEDCMQAPVMEVDTGSTQDGWLVKFDIDGNILWEIQNETGHDNHYYSVVQLSQGGYIACGTWGGSGYLARFSPEEGIEGSEPTSAVRMDVSPNPFSSSLSVSFSLPEAMEATLTVFDLSGRIVGKIADGLCTQGISTIEWIPPDNLGSGCYLVRLNAAGASVTRNCVLIR